MSIDVRELLARIGLGKVPERVLVVVLVACVALAAWSWSQVGATGPIEGPTVGQPSDPLSGQENSEAHAGIEPTASAEPTEPVRVAVHLVGAVFRPGVYEIPVGSRIQDAVELAGGLTGDASERSVNLARIVADGEQVYVPTLDEADGTTDMPGAPTGGTPMHVTPEAVPSSDVVNINTAGPSELETLPGVGPAIAAKIVADREANGLFVTVDDLLRVSGIGEKTLEGMRDRVTL